MINSVIRSKIRLRNYVARIHLNFMIHNIEDCLIQIYPIIIIINFTLISIQYFGLDFYSVFVNDSVQRRNSFIDRVTNRALKSWGELHLVMFHHVLSIILHLYTFFTTLAEYCTTTLTVHVLVNLYGNCIFVCTCFNRFVY